MCERRSSTRQKRSIDYRQFADGHSDDDDDFESSPVPAKKAAMAEQRTTKPPTSRHAATAASLDSVDDVRETGPPPKRARQSRDERQFTKDTEKVLKESAIVASPHSPNAAVSREEDKEYRPPEEEGEEEEGYLSGPADSSDSDFSGAGLPPCKADRKTKTAAESVGRSTAAGGKAQRNTGGKKGSTRESKGRNKNGVESGKLKGSLKNAPPTRPVVATPTSPSLTSGGDRGTPGLGVRKMPKWTPPGPANRENHGNLVAREKSGGTPLIRIGLSRKARVQPLHNSSHV